MSGLGALRNLGPESVRALSACGIESAEDLRTLGAAMAYRIVSHRFRGFRTPVFLYALHGALDDRLWSAYTPDERAALRADAAGPLDLGT